MDRDRDREMDEIMDDLPEDLEFSPEERGSRLRRSAPDPRSNRIPLYLGIAGLIVFIILIVVYSGGDESVAPEAVKAMEARLDRMEQRFAQLEPLAAKQSREGGENQQLQESVSSLQQTVQSMGTRLENLGKQVAALEKKIAAAPTRASSPAPGSSAGTTYVVKRGDTLYSIARKHNTTVQNLRQLNDLGPNAAIYPDQKLRVKK